VHNAYRRKSGNFGKKIGSRGNRGRRQNRQSGKIGVADKIGSRRKSASDRGSVGLALKFFCRIGSRSAKPIFFAEIATLLKIEKKHTFGFESSPKEGTPANSVFCSVKHSEYSNKTAPTRARFLRDNIKLP